MAKKIVFENKDGYVCSVTPGKSALRRGRTLDQIAKKALMGENLPADTPYYIVEESEIEEPYFRDALKLEGAWVDVNMSKARVIHMDRIRVERNEKLDALDLEIKKEEDNGGDVQSLRNKRKILRDIPQSFDLEKYTTTEQLKNAWPEDLKDNA